MDPNDIDRTDPRVADDGGPFADADLISTYTRARAIADGMLVDVTSTAREAGFRVPVAVSAAVWQACVEWPDDGPALQDESGRLWDVLYMAYVAARQRRGVRRGVRRLDYELNVVPRGGFEARRTVLSVQIGPGDDGEPVVTIMEPTED